MAISGDCPPEIPLGLSIGLVVQPDSHRKFPPIFSTENWCFPEWILMGVQPESTGKCGGV